MEFEISRYDDKFSVINGYRNKYKLESGVNNLTTGYSQPQARIKNKNSLPNCPKLAWQIQNSRSDYQIQKENIDMDVDRLDEDQGIYFSSKTTIKFY